MESDKHKLGIGNLPGDTRKQGIELRQVGQGGMRAQKRDSLFSDAGCAAIERRNFRRWRVAPERKIRQTDEALGVVLIAVGRLHQITA